jgi:hypothetical protein
MENYAHISLRLAQPTRSPIRGDAERSEAEGDRGRSQLSTPSVRPSGVQLPEGEHKLAL